jgi:hypothetical protein
LKRCQVQSRVATAQYGGDPTWCRNQYIHRFLCRRRI